MEEFIIVSVRARPLSENEKLHSGNSVWRLDDEMCSVHYEAPPLTPISNAGFATIIDLPKSPSPLVKKTKTLSETPTKSPKSPKSTLSPNATWNSSTSVKRASVGSPLKPSSPSITKAMIKLPDPGKVPPFTFDHVFDSDASTPEIYEKLASKIVWSTMNGFDGTIFAYGQTASGKTFTMKGEGKRSPGLIPLAIRDIFNFINQTTNREFLLRVSYMEIYNEIINDLLSPGSSHLKIKEDKKRGAFVSGLKEEVVVSPEHVMSILAAGEAHRHVGATDFNEKSSRSHTIFSMVIESKQISEGNNTNSAVRVSHLNLIDLAGSERMSTDIRDPTYDYQAAHGDDVRRKEGSYINKSLLTLATVISKLSEKQESAHIPYRDSKLTRILQPSLSGSSRIAIICTISPSIINFEESLSTLKFASRAKKVKSNPRINELMDDKTLIKKYRSEIAELRKRLEEALTAEKKLEEFQELRKQKEKIEEDNEMMLQKLREQQLTVAGLQERIRQLTKVILVSASSGSTSTGKPRSNSTVGAEKPHLSGTATPPYTPRGLQLSIDSLMSSGDVTPRLGALNAELNELAEVSTLQEKLHTTLKENTILKAELAKCQEQLGNTTDHNKVLQSGLEDLEHALSALNAELKSREAEIDKLKSEIHKKDSSDTKASSMSEVQQLAQKLAKEHMEQVQKLESQVIGRDLDMQVIKADNAHLQQQLLEKDRILKEWLTTADTWESTFVKLQKENKQLRESSKSKR